MKKTLRNTLLTWFMVFSVLVILIFLVSNLIYINTKTRITNVIGQIYELHLNIQKDFNLADAFFSFETMDPSFFDSRQSDLLDECNQSIEKTITEIEKLASTGPASRLQINPLFDSLLTDLTNYQVLLNEIVELTLERGFKDYGVVGEMRNYVHRLERYPELDQTFVLGLRRHEKDYIIRGEKEYITKLNTLADRFTQQVNAQASIESRKREEIVRTINNYRSKFNDLVELDARIGIRIPETGKKLRLNQLTNSIEQRFNQLIRKAESKKTDHLHRLEILYVFFYLVFLLISIFLSQYISKRIAAPLTSLTSHIKELSGKNLELDDHLEQQFDNYESSVLYEEFRKLIEQVKKEKEDLQQAQDALVENENKYRQLADNLPQAVFETDQFGNLTYVNSSWLTTFQYEQDEAVKGMNITTVLKTKSGPLVLGDESGKSATYKAIRKDGSTFPALVYTNRIHRDEKLRGFRGAIIDITGRVKKKIK